MQIVLTCWGWRKAGCDCAVCKTGDGGAARRAGGRARGPGAPLGERSAGGAQRPPFLCAAAAASPWAAGAGLRRLAGFWSTFVFACFVPMEGDLLITAFVNISCSTKGRKTCTQTTAGEGSGLGGEGIQTRLRKAFAARWHRRGFVNSLFWWAAKPLPVQGRAETRSICRRLGVDSDLLCVSRNPWLVDELPTYFLHWEKETQNLLTRVNAGRSAEFKSEILTLFLNISLASWVKCFSGFF